MNVKKLTLGVMAALSATALAVVIAASPFAARASGVDGTERPVAQPLQLTDGATSTYIGVALLPVSAAEADQLGIAGGAKVHRVDENGPSSGVLEAGDVITFVNGHAVASPGDVGHAVQASSVGDVLVFTVWRGGVLLGDLSVTVGEHVVRRHGPRPALHVKKPIARNPLMAQILALGDRFARGELVLRAADGSFKTHRAVVGAVTVSDPALGTFTLQPRDGSDPIDYTISDDTKVRLAHDGDIGAMNTTDTTLVIDVDGDVKLVHQGPLPAGKIGKRGNPGPADFKGAQGAAPAPEAFTAVRPGSATASRVLIRPAYWTTFASDCASAVGTDLARCSGASSVTASTATSFPSASSRTARPRAGPGPRPLSETTPSSEGVTSCSGTIRLSAQRRDRPPPQPVERQRRAAQT